MSIPIFDLDPVRLRDDAKLFPDDIEADEWVAFHGTSGGNSERIEREGFHYAAPAISLEQINKVADIYSKMAWCGEDLGGYMVLKAFSLGHDMRDSTRSIIFFAETGNRALLYASLNFAGGEKLRALRKCFADLQAYLDDAGVRERHRSEIQARREAMGSMGVPDDVGNDSSTEIDLGWLRGELASLSEIRDMAEGASRRFENGVVYAVRMTPKDLPGLKWNNAMGIEAFQSIPPSRILGKVLVPKDIDLSRHVSRGMAEVMRYSCELIRSLRDAKPGVLLPCSPS